jgi:hypothetical protein
MRIATGTLLSGLVLLAAAVAGIETGVSFAMGLAALVAGAIAVAVCLEAREQAELHAPIMVRTSQQRR